MAKEYYVGYPIPPGSMTEPDLYVFDDFEGAFNWYISAGGATGIAAKSPIAAISGNFGLLLDTGVPEPGALIAINKSFHFKYRPKIEASLNFHIPTDNWDQILYVMFLAPQAGAAGKYHYDIKIDMLNDKIWVRHSDNMYKEIASGLTFYHNANHYFAFEIDHTNKKYGKIRFGSQIFDASAYEPYIGTYWGEIFDFYLKLESGGLTRTKIYIDNVMVRPA